jgi:hypothetical protein
MTNPADSAKVGAVPEQLELDLWLDTLSAYRDEYKALAEAWSKLDTKAQGTAAIAGIFLAAVFASTRSGAVPALAVDRFFLSFAVLFLILAVVAAGLVLRVQTVTTGPPGSEIERGTRSVLKEGISPSEVADLRRRFIHSQINVWRSGTAELRTRMSRKGMHLRWAQGLLFLGALMALVVTLHTLLAFKPTGG